MATVISDGLEIVYDVLNADSSKTPVFFISGLNGRRKSCMAQAVPFSKDRKVVIHDQRGTGESTKHEHGHSIHNMARDVIAIMDQEGIAKAHFVGTSTGGAITQELCVCFPARVASAAVCCSWAKPDPFFMRQVEIRKKILLSMGTEVLTRMVSATLHDPRHFSKDYSEIRQSEDALIAEAASPQVDAARMDALAAFDRSRELGAIQVPMFIVASENDAVCPPHYSEELVRLMPHAKVKMYRDGGHFFYKVHADQFNADIKEFISSVEQSPNWTEQ